MLVLPLNAVKGDRNSVAVYVDGELKFGDFTANATGRFENYSDFGSTINGKLAMRYEYAKGFSVHWSNFYRDLERHLFNKNTLVIRTPIYF